ncbi:MAG: translation initiation factor IF-2 [Prevotella sp.]|jgi:translation initiation factor IF-2|uniref:translation initiation factor IF-2 n=1 Tax=unclassified Dysgonomonas TaxID=2630389 RepID=UPI0025C36F99|nr:MULTISPECIES: translation initiation factor IF-2 [unclassified Dysgonomonas]MDR1715346.1 translation initiation factor IF-2 [Prevotella sp.]MDR2003634.1 translation initiation factor IF-2 [Prevotella sp.]HMM01626.1 translation initiation factor IF-2 [Dysgonomonas sp.]
MSIRLIKISKDLNVGINSLVEFLHKKGFDVESNPNAKVDGEQHELLVKEFGNNADLEALLRNRKEREKEREREVQPPKEVEDVAPKRQEPEEIVTEVPESFKPHVQVVDKIDLDALNRPKKTEVKEEVVSEPEVAAVEPVAETKVETPLPEPTPEPEPEPVVKKEEVKEEPVLIVEEKEEEPKVSTPVVTPPVVEEEKEEDDIFRLNKTTIKSNIVVKGSIDLSSINDKTRPAKKTKAEKKKERLEKEQQDQKKVKENTVRLLKKETDEEAKKRKASSDEAEDAAKKKRNRIKRGKVDIEKGVPPQAGGGGQHHGGGDRTKHNLRKPIVKQAVNEEDVQKQIKETLARLTGKGGKNKGAKYRKEKRDAFSQKYQEELEMQEQESKTLKITEFVTANDLANMMNVPVVKVISTCMSIGIMVSINQRLDAETINIVAEEFGFKTEYVSAEVVEAINEEEDNAEDLEPRAPIVTVMGHVDHGKTSLLDTIRQTNVIAGEAGGITQHIGAYNVKLKSGRRITFLDTPGHEAFTAMRARGAKVTDIAIIIVAADDNVMPQTVEAINHASAAGVPIVFAINKIDKPGANPEKIKETLAGMNYLVEDWGGKYQSQDISAKQGLGVDELLEKVLLEAELLDLKANPNRRATGSVIESSLDKGRGYLSTVLVENGTLKKGDIVLAGTYFGRVKAMFNERNASIDTAAPAAPALVLGLNGAPQAGDIFHVLETEQEAREIATKREQLQREQGLRTQKILTLDDIGRRIAIGNFQQLNVIVKGDVDGSVEALSDSLIRLSTEEIQVNVIHKAVGQISESDIVLAAASDAIIIGFQVRPSQAARRAAEKDGVEIRLYSIIYDAIEEVKSAMEGMLSPEIKEVLTGYVEVREVFKITKVGTVAGCMVKEGKLKRANKIRLIRDGIVIYSGELGSLKRFKDDVKEVAAGYECGLNIHNYNDIKIGDVIEPFEEIEVKKTL